MNRRGFLTVMFTGATATGIAATRGRMTACTAELPNHVLEFALPEEMARQMSARQLQSRLDFPPPFERGSQALTGTMYDFKGPFWKGALGSLNFHVTVHERQAEFKGEISSARGLEKYLSWWLPLIRKGIEKAEILMLNGVEVVGRDIGTWFEIISLPLDETMFLDFGIRISPVAGRPTDRWGRKAEAMRDAIRASIVLQKKSSGDPNSPRTA